MKALLGKKTKQEKIINEAQKKRNLFGLGLTSLIAACSDTTAAKDEAGGYTKEEEEVDHGTRPLENLEATRLTATANVTPTLTVPRDADKPRSSNGYSNFKINIAMVPGVIDNEFETIFKNGNHRHPGLAAVYRTLNTDQSDLVVSSKEFGNELATEITGAIYIVWDMRELTNFDEKNSTNYLKVAGVAVSDVILSVLPEFYQLGGAQVVDTKADQPDMVFKSRATADAATNINILWDVTQYADRQEKDFTVNSPGILQVQGVGGDSDVSFTKINNNEGYDMILKGAGYTASRTITYILWDVAEYYNKNAKVVVNLAANPDHGLLTIKDLRGDILTGPIPNSNETGFTDIDEGGINDIAITITNVFNVTNTYILFGEKVANRDKDGKAISHTVDLETVAMGDFYDKAGAGRTVVTTPTEPAEKAGFFDFDLDGDTGNGVIKNVGYRFATDATNVDTLANIKTAYDIANPPAVDAGTSGPLSEEAYWDVA